MRITHRHTIAKRRGGITPLTCLLLPLIVGMVAFAVDTSWIVMTRSELQNTADAAALAGANKLGENYISFSLPTQSAANKTALISSAVSAAKTAAKNCAAANSAGGVSGLTLLDADIDVGNTTNGVYISNATNSALYPNTVKVTMRRDGTANTSLKLYFAPVIGVSNVDVQAKATAMAYGGTVNSLRTDLPTAAGVLPVTYDVNAWNTFITSGANPDGTISKDANGNPQIQIYPSVKDTGNFGFISLNDSHVGNSTLRSWIINGPANSDIQALVNNNLIPLSSHNANNWDWQGENGFKASSVSDMNSLVGKTFMMPLFKPFNSNSNNYEAGDGNGSNYYYNVVAFVGVKIMPVDDTNREVVVTPYPITDPNAILNPSSIAPLSGTGSTTVTALAPPKLIE